MNPLNDGNYSVNNDAEDNPENCEENLGNFDDEMQGEDVVPPLMSEDEVPPLMDRGEHLDDEDSDDEVEDDVGERSRNERPSRNVSAPERYNPDTGRSYS